MSGPLDDDQWLTQHMGAEGEDPDWAGSAEGCGGVGAAGGTEGVGAGAGRADAGDDGGVVDLDEPDDGAPQVISAPRRFDHAVAVRLGALGVAGVVAAVAGAVLFYGPDTDPAPAAAPRSVTDPAAVAATAPVPTSTAGDGGGDRPLVFTAAADCPPGSTSAQTLAGADPMSAFVCVRDGVDGQVIEIDLGKPYVLTAISLTPGWVGRDSSGASQWSQHRVVSRVQYLLRNGGDVTVLTQDTGNVHGEAVQPVARVLASTITMLILQTSRPPAQATPTAAVPGGLLDGVFGAVPAPLPGAGGDPGTGDPVDATFAMGPLTVIGHEAL